MHKLARCVVGEVRSLITISEIGACTYQCETVEDSKHHMTCLREGVKRQLGNAYWLFVMREPLIRQVNYEMGWIQCFQAYSSGLFPEGTGLWWVVHSKMLRGVLLYGLLCKQGWGDSKTGISSSGKQMSSDVILSRRPPELFYLSSYPRFHWQIKMFIWYCLPVRSLAAIRHAPSSLHYRNRK